MRPPRYGGTLRDMGRWAAEYAVGLLLLAALLALVLVPLYALTS